MSKGFKLFVSCDKAAHTCDKTQYNEASLWDKIKLNIHLIYCKACRKYSANNAKLTELTRKPEVDCLKHCEKEKLETNFQKELKSHQ
ncbi:hypothetical protein [Pontimicrobium sp. SW4]|uniref:Glycine dehydrogenase n=1 Tax=Pontimicrobium sp. SW4 TaxID=3153519 RepID=A0AAU7BQQ0_9FLAO